VWVSRTLFGEAPLGLRLFPALTHGGLVLVTAALARELGGRRFAQVLAALSVALSPFLIAAHLAGPTVYDLAAWAVVSWLVVRILRTGREQLWLVVGPVVGLALLNKDTILFLVGGLVVGFLVNRQARILRSPWLWAGAAIALLLWMPNIVWQIQNGWPTIEMPGTCSRSTSGRSSSPRSS
jgi:4-amino-4-deoxy-L-arabinose transferase-like glycosyltransferase